MQLEATYIGGGRRRDLGARDRDARLRPVVRLGYENQSAGPATGRRTGGTGGGPAVPRRTGGAYGAIGDMLHTAAAPVEDRGRRRYAKYSVGADGRPELADIEPSFREPKAGVIDRRRLAELGLRDPGVYALLDWTTLRLW